MRMPRPCCSPVSGGVPDEGQALSGQKRNSNGSNTSTAAKYSNGGRVGRRMCVRIGHLAQLGLLAGQRVPERRRDWCLGDDCLLFAGVRNVPCAIGDGGRREGAVSGRPDRGPGAGASGVYAGHSCRQAGGEGGGAWTGSAGVGRRCARCTPGGARSSRPAPAGPRRADQDVSVAVSWNPAALRAEGSGGGQRMDSTRLAAAAAACGGMPWRRPSGIAMSRAWTRMSVSVSRWVTPMAWRREPAMLRISATICTVGRAAARRQAAWWMVRSRLPCQWAATELAFCEPAARELHR